MFDEEEIPVTAFRDGGGHRYSGITGFPPTWSWWVTLREGQAERGAPLSILVCVSVTHEGFPKPPGGPWGAGAWPEGGGPPSEGSRTPGPNTAGWEQAPPPLASPHLPLLLAQQGSGAGRPPQRVSPSWEEVPPHSAGTGHSRTSGGEGETHLGGGRSCCERLRPRGFARSGAELRVREGSTGGPLSFTGVGVQGRAPRLSEAAARAQEPRRPRGLHRAPLSWEHRRLLTAQHSIPSNVPAFCTNDFGQDFRPC